MSLQSEDNTQTSPLGLNEGEKQARKRKWREWTANEKSVACLRFLFRLILNHRLQLHAHRWRDMCPIHVTKIGLFCLKVNWICKDELASVLILSKSIRVTVAPSQRYLCRAVHLTGANPSADNDHIKVYSSPFSPLPCKLNLTLLNGASLGEHSVFEPLSLSTAEHTGQQKTQHKSHFLLFCFSLKELTMSACGP